MRLGFDLDGVFVDFNRGFAALFPDRRVPIGLPDFPPVWDWPQYYGATEEEVTAAWTQVHESRGFWLGLSGYSGISSLIGRLIDLVWEHDLYFITSRTGHRAKWQTERWLARQGMNYPTVLLVKDHRQKIHLIKGLALHAYIDDRLDTLEACAACNSRTKYFLMERPWNKTTPDAYFVRELWLSNVLSVHQMLDQIGV